MSRYIRALIPALRDGGGVSLRVYQASSAPVIGPHALMPLRMRLGGARLIHGPANALPLLRVGLPGIVTIHDLAIYRHPEWFPPGQWFSTRVVVPVSARRARLLICPSEATKQEAVTRLGAREADCRVIPYGVGAEFSLPAAPAVRDEARSALGLPDRYLLQVGTIQPRKNHVTSLRALASIPERERLPLIVAGGFGWDYQDVVETVQQRDLARWVRFVGYVGMRHLPALYQMAEAVLFPSLDEGFGLPVLEAFAAGAPVAASNAGAIPEVAGDAALLSAPQDDATLAEHVMALLKNSDLRERQVKAGRARATLFTWAVSAKAHADAYREAVG